MLPDFEIAPVRRVLYGTEADIYTFSASECIYASFLRDLYGNYYYRLQQSEFFLIQIHDYTKNVNHNIPLLSQIGIREKQSSSLALESNRT